MDLFQTLATKAVDLYKRLFFATKSLRFNLLLQDYQMADLIKALSVGIPVDIGEDNRCPVREELWREVGDGVTG